MRLTIHRPFLGLAIAVAAIACSSNSGSGAAPTPCNEDPWECAPGHTCWPVSPTSFACVISGDGKAGDPCDDVTNLSSCGDGLACLVPAASGGICASYCDAVGPGHGCPMGQTCRVGQLVASASTQFEVCTPASFDAGAVGDAGATDSAASADAD